MQKDITQAVLQVNVENNIQVLQIWIISDISHTNRGLDV